MLVTGHGPLPDGPDDSKLLVGETCLIDLENGSKIWSTRREFSAAQAIFSRDGRTVVSCSVDGLRSWDAKTGKLILKFDLPHAKNGNVESNEDVVAIDLVPRTDLIVGAGRNALHFWNVKSGRYEKSFWCDDDHNIQAIAVSEDGRYLVSGGNDHTVRVWDIKTGKLHCTLFGHDGRVNVFLLLLGIPKFWVRGQRIAL